MPVVFRPSGVSRRTPGTVELGGPLLGRYPAGKEGRADPIEGRVRIPRNISFEEVVFHIERGNLLDVLEHPNQRRYLGQRILVVDIGGYAYLVPCVESEAEIFLKTVIPNRKATNTYLG